MQLYRSALSWSRDIMKPIHVTPEEGLKLANVMGAKIAIPMHWGTFSLGEDSPKTGMRRFLQAPVSGINKLIMKIGETIDLTKFNWLTGQISIDKKGATCERKTSKFLT